MPRSFIPALVLCMLATVPAVNAATAVDLVGHWKADGFEYSFFADGTAIIASRYGQTDGPYKADFTKTPAELDIPSTSPKGEKVPEPAVMVLEGDSLTLGFSRGPKRPASLDEAKVKLTLKKSAIPAELEKRFNDAAKSAKAKE